MTPRLLQLLTTLRWQPTVRVETPTGLTMVRLVAVHWTNNRRDWVGYGYRVGPNGYDWRWPTLDRLTRSSTGVVWRIDERKGTEEA